MIEKYPVRLRIVGDVFLHCHSSSLIPDSPGVDQDRRMNYDVPELRVSLIFDFGLEGEANHSSIFCPCIIRYSEALEQADDLAFRALRVDLRICEWKMSRSYHSGFSFITFVMVFEAPSRAIVIH